MKILHLSKMDSGGGAAEGFIRIHQALLDQGVESVAYVLKSKRSYPFIYNARNLLNPLQYMGWALARIFAKLKRFGIKPVGVYDFDAEANFPAHTIIQHAKRHSEKWDLILVHWSGGFVRPETIREIAHALGARVALWQVDMAHVTGGCHSTLGCIKYQTGCGACPLISSDNLGDISAIQSNRRAVIWKDLGATVLAPSSWSARQAKESFTLHNLQTFIFPIPINLNIFKPPSRSEAREQLGLPLHRRIALVRGINPAISYKGFSVFLSAIRELESQAVDLHIAVIGDAGYMPSGLKHITFTELGRLEGDAAMALAYQACDFFVSPSINDAGPMMVGEAMACGCPFIAYPVGIAPDLIRNNLGGTLVEKTGDMVALATAIKSYVELTEKDLLQRKHAAVEIARELFSNHRFTENIKNVISK